MIYYDMMSFRFLSPTLTVIKNSYKMDNKEKKMEKKEEEKKMDPKTLWAHLEEEGQKKATSTATSIVDFAVDAAGGMDAFWGQWVALSPSGAFLFCTAGI